jgi:branched-chain amino acid aminotransferase
LAESIVWLNGRYLAADQPAVRVDDRGLLFGDGFFDTLRLYGGQPFRLGDHLQRLRESCAAFDIQFDLAEEDLRRVLAELSSRTGLVEAAARTTVTRGVHAGPLGLPNSTTPTVIVTLRPIALPEANTSSPGFRLHVASSRVDEEHPLASHKSLHYFLYLAAREEARRAGRDEALLLNTAGNVVEAAASNLFAVRDGRVLTPPLLSGALPGVTRQAVIEICAAEGIACSEEDLTLSQLVKSDELFLTNSLLEVMPVSGLRQHSFPGPVPGPVTRRLQDSYRQLVVREVGSPSG